MSFSHTLLNLPKVVKARGDRKTFEGANIVRGVDPLPHWMMPGPGCWMPPRPQQTGKQAFFDPDPDAIYPDPKASSSTLPVPPTLAVLLIEE